MAEPRTLTSVDGITLEAELARAAGPARTGMVLCHPHPLQGGTMRSIVIGALFDALPAHGVTCLRFNFRGIGGSGGEWGDGEGERRDALAAVHAVRTELGLDVPLLVAGWSFGGDIALCTVDDEVAGWLAIAPPLRWGDLDRVAHDERPKLLALAEHDEIRSPASVVEQCATWEATDIEIVGGASHYFVGRTDRLVALATRFVDRLR